MGQLIIHYLIRPLLLALRVIMQMSSFAYWEHGDMESKPVGVAQFRSMVHNLSTYHWSGAQRSFHKWCVSQENRPKGLCHCHTKRGALGRGFGMTTTKTLRPVLSWCASNSLRSEICRDPRNGIRCTHLRTIKDHNNAFIWGLRRAIWGSWPLREMHCCGPNFWVLRS